MYPANQPQANGPTAAEDLFGYALEPPLPPPIPARPVRIPKRARATPAVQSPAAFLKSDTEPDCSPEEDEEIAFSINAGPLDPPETYVAKRMWKILCVDLAATTCADLDLLGDLVAQPTDAGLSAEHRKQDALIWMFDLNPNGADMPFEWVCNEIGLDHEAVRRITARNMRRELKLVLKLLSKLVSFAHAKQCELRLSDYANLSGWDLH